MFYLQVKATTKAAQVVAGFDARDGYIRAAQESRSMMPKFISKKDFKNNFVKNE